MVTWINNTNILWTDKNRKINLLFKYVEDFLGRKLSLSMYGKLICMMDQVHVIDLIDMLHV